MQNLEKSVFQADTHIHSIKSDGLTIPKDIPTKARQKKLDIVALTDHDTVDGLSDFLKAADSLNENGGNLLAIAGMELSTRDGHLVVLVPGREESQRFISQYHTPITPPYILDAVEKYIGEYNAICVLPHPGQQHIISGISIVNLYRLVNKLTQYHPEMVANLGVEVENWMRLSLFWNQRQIESELKRRDNVMLGLAEFAGSDAHFPIHIGNAVTTVRMSDLTPESFIKAVGERNTSANTSYRPLAMPEAIASSGLAYVREFFLKKIRRD